MVYRAVTLDGKVESLDRVQVEAVEQLSSAEVLTLAFLDTEINRIQAEIDRLTVSRLDLESVRAEVLAIAETVKLAEPEESVELA